MNETHQQIMDVAAALFATRGYAAVRLRDIADAVGIKHAALYYYAPGGKEQLYVDVMTNEFAQHRAGMEQAIAAAGPGLRDQMQAVAHWLLARPPLHLARMEAADFPAIGGEHARNLSQLAFDTLRLPLQTALEQAQERGTITVANPGLAAITFITTVASVHKQATSDTLGPDITSAIVEQVIDLLLYGLLVRS